MAGLRSGIFLLEVLEDVAHAQARAAHLVGVRGADALARGAHLVLALLCLVGSVEHAVRGHDEMSLLRDVQALAQRVSALLQRLRLVHEQVRGQHHAVADDVHLVALEDARRDAPQHILLALELQRVASIGATLKTRHHIIARGKHVDHLTLAFVAPLKPQQDVHFSFIHFSIEFFLFFLVITPWQVEQMP